MTTQLIGPLRKRGNFIGPTGAPAGFITILDKLSASSAAAFSTRLLRSAYTGKCMNVRRSSDNAAQDIGFVNGVLDTSALLAFVGANNGFVTTWYDQSGNGNNAIQSTAVNQPQIVVSGAIKTINSFPSIQFANGSNAAWFTNSGSYSVFTTATTVSSVIQANGNGFGNCIVQSSTNTPYPCATSPLATHIVFGSSTNYSSTTFSTSSGAVVTITSPSAFTGTQLTTTAYLNGALQGTNTDTCSAVVASNFRLGANTFPDAGNHQATDLVLFASVLSTIDRQTLERNQEAYYGISGV